MEMARNGNPGAADSFNVGARLRALREKHGLSQRELAKRAGVSNAIISLIEQNRTSPSVGSLKKVLDGLPISLAEFFAMELPSRPQLFFSAEELVEIGGGGISYRQVGHLQGRALQILHERYAPGADTGEVAAELAIGYAARIGDFGQILGGEEDLSARCQLARKEVGQGHGQARQHLFQGAHRRAGAVLLDQRDDRVRDACALGQLALREALHEPGGTQPGAQVEISHRCLIRSIFLT